MSPDRRASRRGKTAPPAPFLATLLALLLPAVLLPAVLLVVGCTRDPGLPTYRVERKEFVHRITAEGVLETENTTVLSVPPEVRRTVRLAWLAPEGTTLSEGDLVARFDRAELEKRLADGQSQLDQVRLEQERRTLEGRQSIDEVDTTGRLADLDLEHAEKFRRQDDRVFSRLDILEDSIDEELARERRDNASAAKKTQNQLQKTELELLEIRARRARMTVDSASEGLRALEVRAPHDGILVYARDWQGEPPRVGQELWRGQQVAEIPDLERLEAQAWVLEADAGGLAEGLEVEVVVEARPERPLRGRVHQVEPVAKPRQQGSPVRYFGIGVRLEDVDPRALGLRPGQRLRALLEVERRTDALVVPRQAVFEGPEGDSRVWVRAGSAYRSRAVTLGPANAGLVVIDDGLAEGDVIALAPPSEVVDDERESSLETGGDESGAGDAVAELSALDPSGDRP